MNDRIAEEKITVSLMIHMYCRHKEGNRELCPDCAGLLAYALDRLDRCKYSDNKPTCRNCTVHCYNSMMRARIRKVMRWAGPRIILHHPARAIKHLIREIRNHKL